MAKSRLTREEYAACSDELKGHYKVSSKDDNVYLLIVEGDTEAVEAMRRAKENEKGETEKVRKELAALRDEFDTYKGEVQTREKDFDTRYKTLETSIERKREDYRKSISGRERDSLASEIALQVFGAKNLKVGSPHIRERITVDFDDQDVPSVRFLGADGKDTSREKLIQEFSTNSDFASIVITTGASGAGSPASRSRASTKDDVTKPRKSLLDMTPEERAAWTTSKIEEYGVKSAE